MSNNSSGESKIPLASSAVGWLVRSSGICSSSCFSLMRIARNRLVRSKRIHRAMFIGSFSDQIETRTKSFVFAHRRAKLLHRTFQQLSQTSFAVQRRHKNVQQSENSFVPNLLLRDANDEQTDPIEQFDQKENEENDQCTQKIRLEQF